MVRGINLILGGQSGHIYVFLRDAVRGMERGTTTRQTVAEMFQYQPGAFIRSDDGDADTELQ